jgi:putative SOS response-associated peptidase YedK
LSRRKQLVEEQFDTTDWQDDWSPRFNVAPTQPVPVIRQHPKEPVRQLSLMKWGLIPHWAKDASIASSTINAKSETAATKPAFRDPLKFRRFEVSDGGLFAFAGLWDGWRNPEGQWIKTCSILTTVPNAVTATRPRPNACDPSSR